MEKNLIQQLSEKLGEKEATKYLAQVAGYREVPPTLEEFIEDPYFLGDIFGRGRLYPIWKDHLKDIFPHPLYSPYKEVALSGCIGAGKTTVCSVGIAYDLCRVLYLKDPHATFGLAKIKPLVIAFVNTTLTLSQSVLLKSFMSILTGSPFFKEEMARAKKQDRKAFLPNKIELLCGSRGNHALGNDVMMAVLSELNFQSTVKDQAIDNFVNIERRIKSRFDRCVFAPGRLWLDSSRKDETGFLETYMQDLQSRPHEAKVISHAIWDVMKSAGKTYSGEEFLVFIGQENREPCIIENDQTPESLGLPASLCIPVPEEFYPYFYRDVHGGLRDYAGLSTFSGHKFIPQESEVRASLVLNNPIAKDILAISSAKDDDIINYVRLNELPKECPLFIHFDTASGKEGRDRIGVAVTRSTGQIPVIRAGLMAANTAMTRDLDYETVLAFALVAKPGQKVSLAKLRNFVVDLAHAGYNIGGVSADGHQSDLLLDDIADGGIKTDLISVDRTRDAYELLKDSLLEHRWRGPTNELLLKEILALQDMGKKIDHPDEGGLAKEHPSKDIADACAGSVYNCKLKSAGGTAVSAFEDFADKLEAARKQVTLKDKLMQAGLKQKMRTSSVFSNRRIR